MNRGQTRAHRLDRREFLRRSGAVAGSVVLLQIAIPLGACASASSSSDAPPATVASNAFLRLHADNSISFLSPAAEIGQGTSSTLAMIACDELGADWSKTRFELATGLPEYRNMLLGQPGQLYAGEQVTGGSTVTAGFFMPVRTAAAQMREMLTLAAAQKWEVDPGECVTADAAVKHACSGRSIMFATIAPAAAELPVPAKPALRDPKDWKLIGRPQKRLDIPSKVDGSAIFAVDVVRPGMLYAAIRHAPVVGSTPLRAEEAKARAQKGVKGVYLIDNFVAVVADSWWTANTVLEEMDIRWSDAPNAKASTATELAKLKAALDGPGALPFEVKGDAAAAFAAAKTKVAQDYDVPHLAHATMEPMSVVAEFTADGLSIWTGSQGPTVQRRAAAAVAGLPEEKVHLTVTYAGGGFGRRGDLDYVEQAVKIAQRASAPIKLIWSREEDIQHDQYRPFTAIRAEAALDAKGDLSALRMRVAGRGPWTDQRPYLVQNGVDFMLIDALNTKTYPAANALFEVAPTTSAVRHGPWRGIAVPPNIFFLESLIDELAVAAKLDPIAMRRPWLAGDKRLLAVVDKAAKEAGWGAAREGHALGFACYTEERWLCRVAAVIDTSLVDGQPKVNRIVVAVDHGFSVNPDSVIAQIQGAALFALTAALKGEITIKDGRVEQSNFHDYPAIMLAEVPPVDVFLIPGDQIPGGAGEIGVPVIAPALTASIFALTGKRIRSLPVSKHFA